MQIGQGALLIRGRPHEIVFLERNLVMKKAEWSLGLAKSQSTGNDKCDIRADLNQRSINRN